MNNDRAIELLLKILEKYQKAYYILIKHFASIPDEQKKEVRNKLNELGL